MADKTHISIIDTHMVNSSYFSSIDNVDYHDIKIGGTDDIDRKLKINHIISNPIHIYNLIKEILMFTNEIYPLLSDATLQSGVSFIFSFSLNAAF